MLYQNTEVVMSSDLTQKEGRIQRVQASDEAVVSESHGVSDAAFNSLKAKAEHFDEKLAGANAMAAFDSSNGVKAMGSVKSSAPSPKLG